MAALASHVACSLSNLTCIQNICIRVWVMEIVGQVWLVSATGAPVPLPLSQRPLHDLQELQPIERFLKDSRSWHHRRRRRRQYQCQYQRQRLTFFFLELRTKRPLVQSSSIATEHDPETRTQQSNSVQRAKAKAR